MHRFICDTWSMTEVITSVLQRLGDDIDPNNIPQILTKIMIKLYWLQTVILHQLWIMQGQLI